MELFKDFGWYAGWVLLFMSFSAPTFALLFSTTPYLANWFSFLQAHQLAAMSIAAGIIIFSKIWSNRWVLFIAGALAFIITSINWVQNLGGL